MKRCATHWGNARDKETGKRIDCEECKAVYEAESSPCSLCGAMVTNGAFFKRTSPHLKGTCKKPFKIPASFFQCRSTLPRNSVTANNINVYWISSKNAELPGGATRQLTAIEEREREREEKENQQAA